MNEVVKKKRGRPFKTNAQHAAEKPVFEHQKPFEAMEKDVFSSASKKTATIIYRRQDDSDPREMLFGGLKFVADVPQEVSYSRTIKQLHREERETPDGIRTRARELDVPLPDVLRGNPWFEIDGVKAERTKPMTRVPDTADEYRGYCINWITVSMSADSMDKRWVGEEGLRQRCGVSPTEIAYLRPFFDARRVECADLDKIRAA